ncbi:hypothetical protein ACFQY5_09575 [Paeniroseomonas aquatica]|uniref:hypothetical protein n=1 Tax=Paeniroseomonas aquatica TaxID=373043 RepID=UPI00361430DD
MSTPPRLVPVAEALAVVLGLLSVVAPRRLPLAEAIGRVLAEPLRAMGPVPPQAMALREGWAVAAARTEGAGPYAPVPLPGLAWVLAGAALPPGTDAVLPPFARDGDLVLEPVGPGEGCGWRARPPPPALNCARPGLCCARPTCCWPPPGSRRPPSASRASPCPAPAPWRRWSRPRAPRW